MSNSPSGPQNGSGPGGPTPPDDNSDKDFLGGVLGRLGRAFTPAAVDKKAIEDFCFAIKLGKKDVVLRMIEDGIDLNAFNKTGDTPLHIAARKDQAEIIALLIEKGADPLRGTEHLPDYTALDDAVRFGSEKAAEALALSGGFNDNPKNGEANALHRACEKGKAAIVSALLRAGADPNLLSPAGQTPLLLAVAHKQPEVADVLLKKIAVQAAINMHRTESEGQARTAFQLAVARGETDVVRKMLPLGVFVNEADAEGLTPVMQALSRGNVEILSLLINAGADLNKRVGAHGTPLDYTASLRGLTEPLRGEIAQMLVDAGADVVTGHDTNPLCAALSTGKGSAFAKVLIKAGADVNAPSKDGTRPLHAAAVDGSVADIELLLKAGADVNGRNTHDGATPLMLAVAYKDMDCVSALLAAGANPRLIDADGDSALGYARQTAQQAMVEKIESVLRRETRPVFRHKTTAEAKDATAENEAPAVGNSAAVNKALPDTGDTKLPDTGRDIPFKAPAPKKGGS